METDASPHQLLRTFSYRLTAADALAYASLKQELTAWGKLRWLVLIVMGGVIAGILPESLSPLMWWAIVLSLAILAAVAAAILARAAERYKAGQLRLPPGDILLEIWGDHLVEQSAGGNRAIAFDQIAQVIPTKERLFIRVGAKPVIIPASAFTDDADVSSFAQWLDEASKQAEP